MNPIVKLQRHEAFHYNGTNSADLLDQFNDYAPNPTTWEIQSETGGVLTLEFTPTSETVEINEDSWVVMSNRSSTDLGIMTEAELIQRYADFETEVIGALPAPVLALGVASVPSLIGGASTTVNVTITPTLPDTSYQTVAVLTGGVSLLASLSIINTTKVSGSQVNVTVQNTGLLPLSGASVLVAAVNQS